MRRFYTPRLQAHCACNLEGRFTHQDYMRTVPVILSCRYRSSVRFEAPSSKKPIAIVSQTHLKSNLRLPLALLGVPVQRLRHFKQEINAILSKQSSQQHTPNDCSLIRRPPRSCCSRLWVELIKHIKNFYHRNFQLRNAYALARFPSSAGPSGAHGV